MMNTEELLSDVQSTYLGMQRHTTWGESALFYNPDSRLKKGIYFLTLKEGNGPNDSASRLDRAGVYRVNLGVSKKTYRQLFGELPSRPPAGGVVQTGHDFGALDILLPHPVYAWMGWLCVLNPSQSTYEKLRPLLNEAYALCQRKYVDRMRQAARAASGT